MPSAVLADRREARIQTGLTRNALDKTAPYTIDQPDSETALPESENASGGLAVPRISASGVQRSVTAPFKVFVVVPLASFTFSMNVPPPDACSQTPVPVFTVQ